MKTFNAQDYATEFYDGYWSAPEVLFAIEQVAEEKLPGALAQKIWAEPGPDEFVRVEAMAFTLNTTDSILRWGMSEIYRDRVTA